VSAARGTGRRVKAQGKLAFPNRCAALRDLSRRLAGTGHSVLRAQTHRLEPQIHPELDSVFFFLNARALDATNNRLSCNIVTRYKSCSSTSPTPTLFPSGFEFKAPFEFSTGTALQSDICWDVVLRTAPTSNAVASELALLALLTESLREEGAAGLNDGGHSFKHGKYESLLLFDLRGTLLGQSRMQSMRDVL
jgi:hypothetical protein